MIVTKIMGGLGNQMFQYAAARGLAEKAGTNVKLDTSWFKNAHLTDAPRHYELGCFALDQSTLSPVRQALLIERSKSLKTKLYDATKGRVKPRLLHIKEASHGFDPSILESGNNVFLDGYWQTQKYFEHIRSIILKDFSFVTEMSKQSKAVLKEIKSTNAISLHVRRGDYAAIAATTAFHGLMGLDYYREAVKQITKKVKNPHFFVFSDDPEWCKKNLVIKFPTTYVSHNTDGAEDMRLMIQCQHHIIANSTFSWWGAWLNPNEKKLVYAPKQWFANADMDSKDVLPDSWIKL